MIRERTQRLARNELREAASAKGWSLSNLAYRWGVTVRHLSRVFTADEIEQRWVDAVNGLPVLTRAEARFMKISRLSQQKARPDLEVHPGAVGSFEDEPTEETVSGETLYSFLCPGAILIATESRGEIEEGEEWVVAEVKKLFAGGCMVAVRRWEGDDLVWFESEEDLWSCMVETGREEGA